MSIRKGSAVRGYAAGLALGLLPALAFGQEDRTRQVQQVDRLLQRQRQLDSELASQREDIAPLSTLFDWQWGGWFDYYIFHYQDGLQSQRVVQRPSMYLWTRLKADNDAHEMFARMRLTYEYFNPGDEIDLQQDWIGPNLDRGWYQIDIGKALHAVDDQTPLGMKVRIGRQEVIWGTGYVLDMPLDAVVFAADLWDWQVRGLIGKTIASYPNVDRSEPVDSHSARRFFGVEASYQGWDHHVPFAYALWNDDHTDERPKIAFQNYSYDTEYFGAGIRGSLAHNLNYWSEFVYEGGESYGLRKWRQRDTVDAWGWDIGIEYLWDHATRPRVSGEYMFASGDPQRVFSPTDATGGNRFDAEDTSFSAFGYRDTGIASALANSNLHVWRAGASFVPFPDSELFNNFEAGTNWFLYAKHHARGALSDPTADRRSGYAGWEMDYFLNWRLSSDLSWTIRWGSFFPGDAFSDRGTRHFVFSGLTWSF